MNFDDEQHQMSEGQGAMGVTGPHPHLSGIRSSSIRCPDKQDEPDESTHTTARNTRCNNTTRGLREPPRLWSRSGRTRTVTTHCLYPSKLQPGVRHCVFSNCFGAFCFRA